MPRSGIIRSCRRQRAVVPMSGLDSGDNPALGKRLPGVLAAVHFFATLEDDSALLDFLDVALRTSYTYGYACCCCC